MTREAFIRKWLGNKDYQYTEQNRDLMRDDLDEVINQALSQPPISSPLRLVSAIKEIENAMERWHHARDNDGETLQKINDILVDIGLLGWFNKQ